ncbi:MAG: hypothetical protein KOO60_00150 [Gemmatimonadales bacterium]|nr:hypothetical protein [Gemmatimonadales bacterium]
MILLGAGLILSLGGCATYSTKLANLRPELVDGEFDQALETVEKETGKKDRLLYYLERGMILHFADRWVESNEVFVEAEILADDLFTKSISEGVLSLFTNDTANSYRARPFEMAMVPYYKALNYVYLGQRDEAQVEARRSTEMLAKYVDATLEGIRDQDKSRLEMTRNNAFMLYFSGMLFDWDGELNDAFISYRNAAAAFQANHGVLGLDIPPSLAADLRRLAARLGFHTELDEIRKTCPAVFAAPRNRTKKTTDNSPASPGDFEAAAGWQSGHGEVVLLLEEGFIPQKTQVRIDIPIFEGETYEDPDYWSWELYAGMGEMQAFSSGRKIEYWMSMAFPELNAQPRSIAGARISAGIAGSHAITSQVENLNEAALITFEAEKPSIFFRTILRGLTKYLATRGVKKKAGVWGGVAANLFGSVSEKADTRSWLTLPRGVHLARLSLPAGNYNLKLELLDGRGRAVESRTLSGVQVRAGDWTFLSQRVF